MSSFLLFNFTCKMTVRQMNIKSRTYYFYNDLDARLLKLDKKTSMGLGIYYIGYVTKNLNGILIV